MTDRDSLADRRRALEEEYFRKKEQELAEKMRLRAAVDAEQQEIAKATGVVDREVLEDLREMGFTAETARLLHLVPLIQTAWAEGRLDQREHDLIVRLARAHGVEAGTPADAELEEWLERQPPAQFFERALRAIRALLEGLPPEERAAQREDLVGRCTDIAAVSGGLLGIGGRVSSVERKLLAQISEVLGDGRSGKQG